VMELCQISMVPLVEGKETKEVGGRTSGGDGAASVPVDSGGVV